MKRSQPINTEKSPNTARNKNAYYITTPIYYVNGAPHIGNAYTTIAADAIARYHRQQGRDVFFLTGTDEHGINNERAARARGLTPQQHVDELAAAFNALWDTLGISYDRFIRTTEEQHKRGALEFWRRLQESGDLYRATYSGAYCASCEAYYQKDELEQGDICPIHKQPVEQLQEENYFFRLSRYQSELEQLVGTTDFVQPVSRRNEVLSVLRQGLRDFSVTRQNVRWGIPVPGHPEEVFYVWVDALTNYVTGVGFPDDQQTLERYWPADVHLVGKDIIRFHCLYWPALLLAAGLPLPRHVFAHGWITKDGQKLSKSRGNSIDPTELAARFGVDAVRYYFLRAIPFGQDGDFTEAAFIARYNADLANDFGNLVQRATALVSRYADGRVPAPGLPTAPAASAGVSAPGDQRAPGEPEEKLLRAARALPVRVAEAFERISPDGALEAISDFVSVANRYAEETAPWHLAKDPDAVQRLHIALYHLAEAARLACWYLWPFIPTAAAEGHRRLSAQAPLTGLDTWGALRPGVRVETGPPLFPRV